MYSGAKCPWINVSAMVRQAAMTDGRPTRSRIKPVPGVTWCSHMGSGALFGFFAGFLGAPTETETVGFREPLLIGLGVAVVAGLLAALLGSRFWIR